MGVRPDAVTCDAATTHGWAESSDETTMGSFSSVQAAEALQLIRPPALGHRAAHECALALQVGDINACYQAFAAAGSWEDRWFCLEHVASQELDRDLVDAWVDGWPDHPLPLLVRSAFDTLAGRDASHDLAHVLAIEPDNPLALGLQVTDIAGGGPGDIETALGKMLAVDALYEPHAHFLRAQGPRGNGDIASMLAFARSVDDIVPIGSPLRAMVPLAAVEVMLAEQPDDHLACLEGYELPDAIMMAAGQSVFHPTFDGPPSVPGIKAMSAFTVALVLLQQDDLALMLHQGLDGHFADWPLSLLCTPSTAAWNQLGQHMTDKAQHAALAGDRA